jgi:hypothetical protein
MRPFGMEVITKSLAPKQPKAPEMLASWRSVARLRELNPGDRLCKSLDWNESNLREVGTTLDEAEPGADSTPIFVAEAQVDKSSKSSTNLSRSLRRSVAEVFGFMSTRNHQKLPTPSAMQTHEPKKNVVP